MRTVTNVTSPTGVATEDEVRQAPSFFPREFTGNRQSNAIQDRTAEATSNARSLYPDGAVVLEDVSFTATQTRVLDHKLGRVYRGFSIERARGTHPISITETAQNTVEQDKRTITLNANTACTVNIRVW